MNDISKNPVKELGYNFIKPEYLPKGEDEYYLRNMQNRSGIDYRNLTAFEIETLVRNGNTSDNWNNILVSDAFNAELVRNCKFFGLVRIGKLEPLFLEFSDMKYMVGLYNSTIISSDFGDNAVVDNVNYLSNYIIGNEVIIVNVNELITTDHAKFGNGILKEGEPENIRIWMEICNENAGRKVIPFSSMLAGDAYLWSKYRDDETLLHRFKELTEKEFKKERGYYGKVGDRTIVKNCGIIKDVWIGSDAYIKGANKLKNLTINSRAESRTQIGEGCEIVNGIIDFGCRIFYGVKAVRFVMASHSQLKYGARLINSYLGNNATISCCEVLNSLIFPAHEQHHNNSFLCAALIMGQSNIAAGATIGSNHNSRGADGEIIAARGFWPGLCVSLKHNSKFASFTILAKGDYSFELNIPIPFSLVLQDPAKNELHILPAYWFMYNMYALSRNCSKSASRDERIKKIQCLEYDFLAPDTINEMFDSLQLMEFATGKAYLKKNKKDFKNSSACIAEGKRVLLNDELNDLSILAENVENSKRKIVLIKVKEAYSLFKKLIQFYGVLQLKNFIEHKEIKNIEEIKNAVPQKIIRNKWLNVGGQLMTEEQVDEIKNKIKAHNISSWNELHKFYTELGNIYAYQKALHGLACLEEINNCSVKEIQSDQFQIFLDELIKTKEWMVDEIYNSRAKDYSNPYRKMVFDNEAEMNNVLGKLDHNAFIREQIKSLTAFKKDINQFRKKFNAVLLK